MSKSGLKVYSTPIKQEYVPESDNESIDESHPMIKKEYGNHSVDDLLHAIDKNISSTSFHSDSVFLNVSNANSNSFNSDGSNDPSPIKPLNYKQQQQQLHQGINDVLCDLPALTTPLKENVMQDIPRAPSFDELEFNTKVNRTSSLSRLNGPRQLSSSSIHRSLSNKLPTSHSNKSLGGPSTRDNSPSKKSVCFENSPPKILEYDELSPENSDNSYNEEHDNSDPFESNWNAKIKPSLHALPPLPPKHVISSSAVSSPTKETSIGSLDGSFEDDHIELTQDEIKQNRKSLTLEKRLDLVLSSNEVSERVQNDEVTRGSSSPQKSLTKREEELIYNIRSKDEIEKEQSLRDAADLFEVDLRNNDKESNSLNLSPQLKRKNSNNSLRDEERELKTTVVQNTSAPLVLEDGMKNVNAELLQQSTDDLVSLQSAFTNNDTESFASATEIMYQDSEDDSQDAHNDSTEQTIMKILSKEGFQPTHEKSSNSISTLRGESPVKGHKKKLSLSDSINNGLSYISSFGKNVKEAIHKRTDSGSEIKEDSFPDYSDHVEQVQPSRSIEESAPIDLSEIQVVQSYQSSTTERDYDTPRNSVDPSESLPLMDHQTAEPTPSMPADESQDPESTIDVLDLQPPIKLTDENEDGETSFSDEFKDTGIFNTSGSSDNANVLPIDLQSDQKPTESEIPTDELDEDSLNEIEASIKSETSSMILKFEAESEPKLQDEIKKELKEEHEVELPSIKRELPSFNSTLFHDKEPQDDDVVELKTPPTDFISIWNNQPKTISPKPQYTVSQRKVSPPERVLKLLQRRISSGEHEHEHEPDTTNRDSIISNGSAYTEMSRRSSLVATSVSRPTYIRVNSRNSYLYDLSRDESQIVNRSLREPDASIVNSSNILANSSDIVLPELTNSSDFADAFKDWEIEKQQAESNANVLKDLNKENNVQAGPVKKLSPQEVKNIWQNGSDDPTPSPQPQEQSRTPSIDAGKLQNFINQNGVQGEHANVKSTEAFGQVIVSNNEDHGITVEIDQDSRFNSLVASRPEPVEKFVDAEEHPVIQEQEPITEEEKPKRFISGSSQDLENVFDLNEEFDRALQIKEQGYATRESNQIIVAKSTTDDNNTILDPTELSKPMVPEVDNLNYMKQRSQKSPTKYGDRVPSARMRAPLSAVPDGNVNIRNNSVSRAPTTPVSAPLSMISDSNLNIKNKILQVKILSNRVTSDDYQAGELSMKKREPQVSHRKSTIAANENVELPKSDLGRLYIHINSLNDVLLDQIKYHKAHFRLYLDNGKHVISTPKLVLDNNLMIDKEFEVAIEEELTDLFFTLKISYHSPEQELVEVVEKIPVKSNRLSRLIGLKPKFRYEKRFVTKKREKDDWDNKFANDGSFGKNKITFHKEDNDVTGKLQSYIIELFNEWETVKQSDKFYKKPPHLIGKLNVNMLYIPRTSPLETLPPSIKVGYKIADHLVEQSNIRYEGFLFQEGGDCELWKRRFFKIEGTKLIAHQETTLKPRAQINLLKVVDILHDGKKTNGERNFTDEILMSDCFKLKFLNGEIINFNAETKDLKKEWIEKLEKVVELNKFHQPWVKTLTQNM